MDEGKAAEFAPAAELLNGEEETIFSGLVDSTGPVVSAQLRQIAARGPRGGASRMSGPTGTNGTRKEECMDVGGTAGVGTEGVAVVVDAGQEEREEGEEGPVGEVFAGDETRGTEVVVREVGTDTFI